MGSGAGAGRVPNAAYTAVVGAARSADDGAIGRTRGPSAVLGLVVRFGRTAGGTYPARPMYVCLSTTVESWFIPGRKVGITKTRMYLANTERHVFLCFDDLCVARI